MTAARVWRSSRDCSLASVEFWEVHAASRDIPIAKNYDVQNSGVVEGQRASLVEDLELGSGG